MYRTGDSLIEQEIDKYNRRQIDRTGDRQIKQEIDR